MFNLSKFSDKLLKELCDSELNLQKCKLCDFQLLEDINKEIINRGMLKVRKIKQPSLIGKPTQIGWKINERKKR